MAADDGTTKGVLRCRWWSREVLFKMTAHEKGV